MRLTVVLPFFDERALLPALPDLLERIRRVLADDGLELLAVDDGSADGTGEALDALPGLDRVLHHPVNRGVGASMNTGFEAASGEAVLVYDPDEAYAVEDLARLRAALEQGADLATLSPYHPRGGVEGVGPLRRLLSRAASALYRRALRDAPPLFTYTCAVRAYRLEALRPLLPAPDDFTAAAWLAARALRAGLQVREIPAVLRARRAGSSKLRLVRTARAHLRLLRDLSVTAPRQKVRRAHRDRAGHR